MTRRPNAELTQLREQMTALAPGVVTNAAETAAPILAKIIGYAELASTFLPQIRQILDRGTTQAARSLPLERVAALQERLPSPSSWVGRGRSWRTRSLVVALPICAGLVAYAAWRLRSTRRVPRKVPPG